MSGRITLIGIACICAIMGLSSCAKTADPEPENKLTVWAWDPNFNIYAIKKAADIYAETHPGFGVETIEYDNMEAKLIAIASSGDLSALPDIFLMQDSMIAKYASYYPELFYDLTDSGIDFSQFAPAKTAYSTIEGRHVALPFDNGAAVQCLRTDYLAAAGLTPADFTDITWDEFIEKGKIVREKTGLPLLAAQAGAPDLVQIMLYSAGASLFSPDGSPDIADNAVLKTCMAIYERMVREGVLVEVVSNDQRFGALNTGSAAAVVEGCWVLGVLTVQADQSGKWALTTVPRLSGIEGATNYSSNGGASWVVSAASDRRELASDFLRETFAGSIELYEDLIQKGALASWLPAGNSSVYDTPVDFFGGEKIYARIVEYAAKTPAITVSPFYYDARDAVGVALSNIIQRGADIDAELKNAQSTVEFNMAG